MSERKTAFVKNFGELDNDTGTIADIPLYERLNATGLFPEILALKLRSAGDKGAMLMEKIDGFNLAELPEWLDEYKYSVEFAKKLAQLYLDFYDQGFRHIDWRPANVMIDVNRRKLVFVDSSAVEEIRIKDEHTLRETVNDFSLTLAGLYMDGDYFTLEDNYEFIGFNTGATRGPALILLNRSGALKRVNPQVRELMIRGLALYTCPENFDELFAIKEDKASGVV